MWPIVGFWVDDATSTGTESHLLELEEAIKDRFGISSEGKAHWILSTSIHHDAESHSVSISQRDYIENIAVKFNTQNNKPVKLPIPLRIDFSAITPPATKEEEKDIENLSYHELIGSLRFTAMVSHPNIAYSVNKLVQYFSNLSPAHWNPTKRVLQYLYSMKDQVFHLGGENLCFHAYFDMDFTGDSDDSCSTGR